MTEKSFMTVEEVAAELRVSKSKAYQIVRELNAEMQKQGYLTVAGRVTLHFFIKRYVTANRREMMEWLYTRTTLRGRGGLSTALPTGKGRGNRHKREGLQPKGKRRRGSMKPC